MSANDVIAELRTRIETLEQTIAADQLQPNPFSLNAKGQLEEKLSGELEAFGITFHEGAGEPVEGSRAIQWVDTETTVREQIYASTTGGIHQLQFRAISDPAVTRSGRLTLRAGGALLASLGYLEISFPDELASLATKRLLESDGKSDFLQLATRARARAGFGRAVLKWAGAGRASGDTVIATGLTKVTAFVATAGGAGTVVIGWVEVAEGQVRVRGWDVESEPGAGAEVAFYWIAIGE